MLRPGAAKLVRIPDTGVVVTLKQAIYAAFVGDIPPGHEVFANCGEPGCLRPDHQFLLKKENSTSRGLFASTVASTVAASPRAGKPREESPAALPRDVTPEQVEIVRRMDGTHTLREMSNSSGLSMTNVMKIRGGVFDRAIRAMPQVAVRKVRPLRRVDDGEIKMTAAERHWLEQMAQK